jgi:hypothetical protein
MRSKNPERRDVQKPSGKRIEALPDARRHDA